MGVFAPLTTPFDEKGEVAYDKLIENMNFYAIRAFLSRWKVINKRLRLRLRLRGLLRSRPQ